MNPVHPEALHYILQEEIYLLPTDRDFHRNQPKLPVAPQQQTHTVEFNYSGNYKNGFLIITHYIEHMYMDPVHLTALESTLKRVGIDLEDAGILNLAIHNAIKYRLIVEHLQPQKVLILGSNALPAEAPFTLLNQQKQVDNALWLYTYSFGEMVGNKENTKVFWNKIKQF